MFRITSIDPFWIVTKATPRSELADILFQTTLTALALQYRGGLDPATILLMTDDREAAHDRAVSELQRAGVPHVS
jgi:hypothetical protein